MMRAVGAGRGRRLASCAMRPALGGLAPVASSAGTSLGVINAWHVPAHQRRFEAGEVVKGELKTATWRVPRSTKTEEQLRDELPEVFEQPVEVEDYIRPEKTYFEYLEDGWDWIISFMSPVEKQMEWMRGLHFGLDFSWGLVFILWGISMRLLSLPPMLYSHRNTLRMGRCTHLTTDIQNNMKRLKNDKSISTPERRVLMDGYKRMEKAIYKKHNCSRYGTFVAGASSPLLISAFMAIRRLAAYEDDLESASFLWVTDLTMPDPTYGLPFICSMLFLSNFEMNQALNRGGRSAMSMYVRWGIRVGALFFTYWFASQPSCLFAYWIGMSSAGMVQPMLLRNEKFREYFNFPAHSKTAAKHLERTPIAWIISKLTNQDLTEKVGSTADPDKKFETINDQDIILDDDEPSTKKKAGARS